MLRAYKTRLIVNDKERTTLRQYAGASRFVYNWALADRKAMFDAGGKPNMYEQVRRFNALKGEQFPWLSDVAYKVIEGAFRNLDQAYQNFFRRVKSGTEKPGFPKFKSKHKSKASFSMRGSIHVEADRIKLPRLGWLRLAESDYLPIGIEVKLATVSETAGHWYISIMVEDSMPEPARSTGEPIGIDLGVKTLAVFSDGTTFKNPKTLKKYERGLARLQREFSRRKKGSSNRAKTRSKIAKMHYKIACTRKHALHEVSHYATAKTKPSAVVLEDLNVKGMVKNHSLAKAISDASFSELRRQIEYKAAWNGVDVLIADRWYPSSKTCSECGHIKTDLTLKDRTYTCPACGVIIDRDLNAARNLAALAL
mgnify:CR=1 FL=1